MKKKKQLAVPLVLLFFLLASCSSIDISGIGGRSERGGNNLIFSYYDLRTADQGGPGLTDNYFTVINTDHDEWVQAHVRVRTGQCSVELLDFDVLLSPNDVFTFDLYQAPDGDTVFASCDRHTLVASGFAVDASGCFILDTGTFPAQLSLIQECGQCPDGSAVTLAGALEATRWGYVEVIGEVEMRPNPEAEPTDDCSVERLEAGEYNSYTWNLDSCFDFATDPDEVEEATGVSVEDPTELPAPDSMAVARDLVGRVYYAVLDSTGSLLELSTSNASAYWFVCGLPHPFSNEAIGPFAGGACSSVVLHRPCYSDSSPGCSAGQGELENPTGPAGFAYSAPSTDPDPAGANDMNYCFWEELIGTDNVINRVGAGATFGPTQADLWGFGEAQRDGDASRAESIISILNLNLGNRGAMSHYFNLPGQGQTHYVFTFPFQHFIDQRITVTKTARFDTEQNECVIPTGKFISPGLPGAAVPRGEVTIIDTQESSDPCTFNEGWLSFALEVTQDGPGFPFGDLLGPIAPAVLGTVVNYGVGATSRVHATAPMQWNVTPFMFICYQNPSQEFCNPFPDEP
jgi:hypothetical protein